MEKGELICVHMGFTHERKYENFEPTLITRCAECGKILNQFIWRYEISNIQDPKKW